jgi:hypothetical protein
MVSDLGLLELQYIEAMSRQQLIEAIRARLDGLPADLREDLEERPTDELQLLLLAARLTCVLRQLRSAHWARNSPRG